MIQAKLNRLTINFEKSFGVQFLSQNNREKKKKKRKKQFVRAKRRQLGRFLEIR